MRRVTHMSRNRLLLLGAVLASGAVVLLPYFSRGSNCGGNSAALASVHQYAMLAIIGAKDSPDHTFRVGTANAEQQKELAELAHSLWIPKARFLVSNATLSERESQPRRVIVVCDTPYCNVPRRWIGSAPYAHAAGFSDGSAGLISPAEFAALDRSSFAFLDVLYPSQSPENAGWPRRRFGRLGDAGTTGIARVSRAP